MVEISPANHPPILLSSSPQPPRPGQSVSDCSEMVTGQASAQTEYDEYDDKVVEDELFIVQNGE